MSPRQVNNSNFERNAALAGGGITAVSNTTAEITKSQFSYNNGGGIKTGINTSLNLQDSFINHNTSAYSGGGVNLEGNVKATITNTVISNNTAYYGGGLEVFDKSEVKIYDSQMTGNSA